MVGSVAPGVRAVAPDRLSPAQRVRAIERLRSTAPEEPLDLIVVGGGVVAGFLPDANVDGTPLREGWIALQSESHPIQFRNVELLDLSTP